MKKLNPVWLNNIVKVYGVYFKNNDEDAFVICPECDEPILAEDWDEREYKYCCPICEYEWEF